VLFWIVALVVGALVFFALGVITAFWAGHVLHHRDDPLRRTIREPHVPGQAEPGPTVTSERR
jgi:hypothetical protein